MVSVGVVTTLKAPPEEVVRFVNYHLNIGMDHLYLYFDNPEDAAMPLVSGLPRVTCVRCDQAYWADVPESARDSVIHRQGANGTRALQMARERGLDWLFHIDIDELIYSPSGIKKVLAQVPARKEALVLRTLEAVPEQLEAGPPFSVSCYFRALPRRRRSWPVYFKTAVRLGCKKYFLDGRYFRGHQVGKSAVRTSADTYRINPHRPLFRGRKCRPYFNHDGRVLHYESNDFDAWNMKMKRWLPTDWQNNPRAKTLTPQLEKIAAVCEQGGTDSEARLKVLYKQLYFIGPAGRFVLRALKLMRKIELDSALFDPPKETL